MPLHPSAGAHCASTDNSALGAGTGAVRRRRRPGDATSRRAAARRLVAAGVGVPTVMTQRWGAVDPPLGGRVDTPCCISSHGWRISCRQSPRSVPDRTTSASYATSGRLTTLHLVELP